MAKEWVANMKKTSFSEWIAADADEKGNGASGFLAGIAMPGLPSIIEKQPHGDIPTGD